MWSEYIFASLTYQILSYIHNNYVSRYLGIREWAQLDQDQDQDQDKYMKDLYLNIFQFFPILMNFNNELELTDED